MIKKERDSVRLVQFLLNARIFNRFPGAFAAFALVSCTAASPLPSEARLTLFAAYPFAADTLEPARPYLLKADGEGLYRLALQNEKALKARLDQEARTVRPSLCSGCDERCRKSGLAEMKALTDSRNEAQVKQLRIRLDALQYRLSAYFKKERMKPDLAEFARHRLLLEAVARERLVQVQDYWLQSISACDGAVTSEQHWFLPYYTAYFRLMQSLPESVRSDL